MSPSRQEKRRIKKARRREQERAEKEKLESMEMNSDIEKEKLETKEMTSDSDQEGKDVAGPGGSVPAVRHFDPNDPLSKPPRYSAPRS